MACNIIFMNDDSLSEAGTMWGQNCCLCSLCLSEIKIIHIKINYDVACTLVGIEPLQFRRDQLCLKFAYTNLKQQNSLLTKVTKTVNTRSKPDLVIEPKCNTKRFRNSSIPYLSRIVNKNLQKK